jgi:hypothetical protein
MVLFCLPFFRVWGRNESVITEATTGLLYQPRTMMDDDHDDDDCGAVGGMRIGKGNRITGRIPAAFPLCPPQIPHDLTGARSRARRYLWNEKHGRRVRLTI